MKIELKNIVVNSGMSEETYNFCATVWVDGQNVGTVGNHGHGGGDRQDIDAPMLAAINAWLANNNPPIQIEGSDYLYDLETWCSDQIGDHLTEKDMVSVMRRKVLFAKEGKIYELTKGKEPIETLVQAIQYGHGANVSILNLLPKSEALVLYKQAAGA